MGLVCIRDAFHEVFEERGIASADHAPIEVLSGKGLTSQASRNACLFIMEGYERFSKG